MASAGVTSAGPSFADAIALFRYLVLGPIAALVGAAAGSVCLTLTYFSMTLYFAPVLYFTLARATCVSRLIGPIAKMFGVIVLPLPFVVAVPMSAVAGAVVGLGAGAIAGATLVGIISAEENSSPGKSAVDYLFNAHQFGHAFLLQCKENCDDTLETARTKELAPGQSRAELNPVKATTSVLAGTIGGVGGLLAYGVVAVRWYVPITLSTWSYLHERREGNGSAWCLCVFVAGVLAPVAYFLVFLLYPLIGLLVCFFYTAAACYLAADPKTVLPKATEPPKRVEVKELTTGIQLDGCALFCGQSHHTFDKGFDVLFIAVSFLLRSRSLQAPPTR